MPMVFGMQLRGFRRVMGGVMQVSMSCMSVMRRRLVVAVFVVPCRFAMVLSRLVVVIGCLVMMFCRLP